MNAAASPQLVRWLSLCWLLAPAVALAHVGQGDVGGGFVAGIEHPIFGLDHVIAMVAVGMWGAQLGAPAIWVLPVTFPLVMAFGGVLGAIGVPIPGHRDRHRHLGGRARRHGRIRGAPAALGRRSTGRHLRHLPRLRSRRGAAGIGQCHRLLGRLRGGHRPAPRARHPDRRASTAGRQARGCCKAAAGSSRWGACISWSRPLQADRVGQRSVAQCGARGRCTLARAARAGAHAHSSVKGVGRLLCRFPAPADCARARAALSGARNPLRPARTARAGCAPAVLDCADARCHGGAVAARSCRQWT